jgi:acetoin utilization deacetylase AcuC-like enzyme
MEKYELLPEQLLYEGVITENNLFQPALLDEHDILRVHTKGYLAKLLDGSLNKSEARKIGFPFSQELLLRERVINQGTIDCAYFALEFGVSMNIAGGTHHAYSDRGEGFCILNDQAIAAQHLIDNRVCKRVLIVDLDVHQGNGTAEIFSSSRDVFTFSMHGAKNYPLRKEKSYLDIALDDGSTDEDYLPLLETNLTKLVSFIKPDFIFYQSGVDVLDSDKLGRLSLTINGCKRRDELVFRKAFNNQIPIVACMGGGYSTRIQDIVEAHANTFKVANEIYF